jgi:hypothetical protein
MEVSNKSRYMGRPGFPEEAKKLLHFLGEKTIYAQSDIVMNNIELRMISEPPISHCMKKAESDIMSDFGFNFSLTSKPCNAYVCLFVSVFIFMFMQHEREYGYDHGHGHGHFFKKKNG